MKALNKFEMQYLVGLRPPFWRNPVTHKYEAYPFSQETLALLASFLVEETDHLLCNKWGVNIHLCAYREIINGPLLGFLWASNAEEEFYGDDYFSEDIVGPFEVTRKEYVAYNYSKADRSPWI